MADLYETDEVSALTSELERVVIDGLRTPLLVGAAASALYFVYEWQRADLSIFQVLQGLDLLLLALVLRARLPHHVRKLAFVVGIVVQPACALFHYGPLLGTGVYLTGAMLSGAFFFGSAGAVVTFTALVALIAACGALTLAGVVTPGHSPLDAREWLRLSMSTLGALAMCGYLFTRITAATREAFAHVVTAKREKESAQLGAQRLESLSRLAGGIAHELNNALQVIQSGVGLLRGAGDPAVIHDVAEAVDAAASTSKRLLAFGRARPEDAGRSSPIDVVQSFASSAHRTLPPTTAIVVELPAAGPDVGVAAPALEEVLTNLVANASEAMPVGGTITIRVLERDHDVVISVEDTGPGIPADAVDHVFDPFFTTRAGKNGLGLAAVWNVVTRVGGSVAYTAKPGESARFELRFHALTPARPTRPAPMLPAALEPAATQPADATTAAIEPATTPSPTPAAPMQPAPIEPAPMQPALAPAPPATSTEANGGRRRLLLVEDEPQVARIFVRILERADYDVTSFERVAPALEALAATSFDGLMTDVVVPEGGVAGLIDQFRKKWPDRPVLVCSGHVEEDLVAHGIARGEFRFLRKPFAGPELLRTLDELFMQNTADARAP